MQELSLKSGGGRNFGRVGTYDLHEYYKWYTNCCFSFQEEDYDRCAQESIKIEGLYGHYFDATIVNENIDIAYEELLATIRVFSTGKHWVPANWVMWDIMWTLLSVMV